MSPSRLLREIVRPFTDPTILVAMLLFFLLLRMAVAASTLLFTPFVMAVAVAILGILLLIAVLPGLFQFLLKVLDARIVGRKVEPPGVGEFSWLAGVWAHMPLVLLVAAGWALFLLNERWGAGPALALGIVTLLVYPASMAILSLTRSWFGCINPLAILTLFRLCGPRYLLIPAVLAAVAALLFLLQGLGAPRLLLEFGAMYLFFLLFGLTGEVVGISDASKHVENPEPVEPGPGAIDAQAEKTKVAVINHAYGLISRGNRAGGFAHIEDFMAASASSRMDDYRWFFEEMLRWEETVPALFFAQQYLRFLLDANEQRLALKLLARCLLESPTFRPLAEDRQRVLELVRLHDRDDLGRQLT